MSRARIVAGFLGIAGLVLPHFAWALICETIGTAAARFNIVAADKVVTKPRVPYGGVYSYGCNSTGFDGSGMASCSRFARPRDAVFDSLTASQSTGTAVRFRDGGEFACTPSLAGQIVTGGGAVRLSGDVTSNVTDTTGTHPAAAACDDAITGLQAASAAFAAMPPVRTYNKIFIKRGKEFVIDTTGAGVINIQSLVMEGVPVEPGYGGYRTGSCLSNLEAGGGPAVLRIEGDSLDDVVLNVGNLEIGGCAEVYMAAPVLFNVHGRGRKVRIGISAFFLGDGLAPDILAPERLVYVTGGRTDLGTPIAGLYARKLVALGYVYAQAPLCKTCVGNGTPSNGVNPGEVCDRGSGCPAGFYCDATCSVCGTTRCGDGIMAGAESCDVSDGCPPGLYCNTSCAACTVTRCNDGVMAGSEACDGALGCTAPEVCNSTCSACTLCGNGALDGGETCDGTNGCTAGTYCDGSCSACASSCGDGIVAGSEVCDRAGNVGCAAGTYCNSSCSTCASSCGDGIIAGSEVCDGTSGCDATAGRYCNFSCSSCTTRCGDGIVAGSETCDGAVGCAAGTSCNTSCSTCNAQCGDGIVAGSEVCDGPGTCTAPAFCNGGCSACITCGNGVVDGSDTCDGFDGCAPGTSCNATCSSCAACPAATTVPAEGGTFSGTTAGGTSALGSCGGSASSRERTFEWTPAASGLASFELCGSSYDTILYVRQGGCRGVELGCRDDQCGLSSRLTASVTAGRTYTIVVDGYNGASGSFVLTVTPPAP